MSRENVEAVERAYAAWGNDDLDAFFEFLDPEIELHVSDAYFDAPHTYRGHDGMRELIRAQAEVFDTFHLQPERVLDAGDRILAIVRAGGRARATGIEVSGRFGHLLTLRHGKVVAFKEFKDPREALEAVGLRE